MTARARWGLAMAAAALLAALLAACGGANDARATPASAGGASASSTASPLAGRVSVFAAASLTDVFRSIGSAFSKAHPGASVEFNFASSSALAAQIEQAAPANVFASADVPQMQRLADQGLLAESLAIFARNLPVIVVSADNGAGITTPKDLARPGLKLVLAAPDVPIGHYARQIIDRLAAEPGYGAAYKDATLKNVVSNEANVRAVLTKIELGEADAGVVYRTDALGARGKVKTIALPDGANVVASYPIAIVSGTRNAAAAAAFVAFVRGAEGQQLLQDAGFDAP